jgi:hypothetical protein
MNLEYNSNKSLNRIRNFQHFLDLSLRKNTPKSIHWLILISPYQNRHAFPESPRQRADSLRLNTHHCAGLSGANP